MALGLLAVGIVLVQSRASENRVSSQRTTYVGIFAMLTVNLTSGYAGVFLERLFKHSDEESIWVRNVQLCVFSVPIALASVVYQCRLGDSNLSDRLFAGFDSVVILIILLSAIGGLITAFVMRYASAVLKCFAVSFSICLCTVAEALHGTAPSIRVSAGIFLVSASIFSYTKASLQSDFKPRCRQHENVILK